MQEHSPVARSNAENTAAGDQAFSSSWFDEYAQDRLRYQADRLRASYRLNDDQVADVMQTMLQHVTAKQAKFDPTRSNRRTYTSHAFAWAASRVEREMDLERTKRNHLKAHRKDLAQQYIARQGGTCEPVESGLVAQELRKAAESLPPVERELVQAFLEGSAKEAAHTLGVSTTTVYRRLQLLRSVLKAHHE